MSDQKQPQQPVMPFTPSFLVRQRFEDWKAQNPGVNPLQTLATLVSIFGGEVDRMEEINRRLLELVFVLLTRTGDTVPPDFILTLRDLRGCSRLVTPRGDDMLEMLMRAVVGPIQQAQMRFESEPGPKGVG